MWRRKLFGPPGTGKTSALLLELEEELASDVKPERVAFMTFTVAARKEAVTRVMETFKFPRSRLPHFRTVHSAAFRQMDAPRSAIVTPDKIAHFAQISNIEFTPAAVGNLNSDTPLTAMMSSRVDGDRMMAFDHLRRHRMQSLAEATAEFTGRPLELIHFTKSYVDWKNREGLYDFTDLLLYASEPLDIDVVFIDEAQDLSKLQWAAVWRLCANAKRMYVAGDDDQAIFEWAGADPGMFIDLKANDVHVLGQSYRVPALIHNIAGAIVQTIRRRQPKEWQPRDEDGSVHWEMGVDWWTPPKEGTTFVLARNKKFLLDYESHLRQLGVPYRRNDTRDVSVHRWSRSVVAWERQRAGHDLSPDETNAVEQAVMPGSATNPSEPWFEALTRVSESDRLYIRAILRRYGNEGLLEEPRVLLSTIHAVKGQQADHVVMDARFSPIVLRKLHDEDPESEARVAYVGVTRAKESFTLVGDHHPLIPVNLLGKEAKYVG